MNVIVLLLASTTAAGGAGHAASAGCGGGGCAAAPASCAGGCGPVSGCCDPCDSRPGLLDRLRAGFRKGCCEKPPRPQVCCGQGSGCYRSGPGVLHRNKGCGSDGCCGATSAASCGSCDGCGGGRPGLLDRLRGMFRKRGDDCCGAAAPAGCCGTAPAAGGCCAGGAAIAPHGAGGAVIVPGTVPHGTYAAPPGTTTTPPNGGQPREKLPPSDGKGNGKAKEKDADKAAPIAAPKAAPKAGAARPSVTTIPVLTPTAGTAETETKRPFEARRRDEGGAAAKDFSRVTGRLTYVRADGGRWLLRYASLGHEDGNGGGVVLANDRRMSSYRDGDVVTVEGKIIAERASARFGAPLYQANSIRLVERPAQ